MEKVKNVGLVHFNHLGGMIREMHHVKVMRDGNEVYEPSMVILNHGFAGRSFIIPMEAGWKYLDPSFYRGEKEMALDREEFEKLSYAAMTRKRLAVTYPDRMRAAADLACCAIAVSLAKGMSLMLCTSWNLAKILQMFDISPCPQAAAQLLLWIQNGLDDLKNFPDAPADHEIQAGEVTLFEDGLKVATKDLMVNEMDFLSPQGAANA